MKWGRALLCGALGWVLIFFEVSILMFGFGLQQGNAMYYVIHFILLVILAGIVSAIYFNGKKVDKGFGEGLVAGVLFVIVGVILDSVITVPLFVKNYNFFISIEMWISYVLTILVTGIVGAIKK